MNENDQSEKYNIEAEEHAIGVHKERDLILQSKLLKRQKGMTQLRLWLILISLVIGRFFIGYHNKFSKYLKLSFLTEEDIEFLIGFSTVGYIILLFFMGSVLYYVLTSSILISGEIIIDRSLIEIKMNKSAKNTSYLLNQISDIKVVLNYVKKNDVEPRDITKANNNSISFRYKNKKYKYEFLIETLEKENKLRDLVSYWQNKGLEINFSTVLADY